MSKVDVIITCYNKEDTIARAINSVKQQTLTDFTCIVVNDGSADNSQAIIEHEIENDARFVSLQLKNCGVANARNEGIKLGNSPYINCLDGDDWYYPEFLQTCYDAISQDRSLGIVYTEMLLAHPDDNFTIADWKQADFNEQFNGKNQVPCCNLFRRDIFERLGGYRQRYAPNGAGAEDAELWLRFFKLGYKAKKVTEQPLFIYNAYGGLTQDKGYHEVNWTNWHNTKPAPSLQKPDNGYAHIVNEYDRPEISVIIPVCDKHIHYLPDALDSLEAQTFTNWEAIVVFDGIKHGYSLSKEFKKSYPYIKCFGTASSKGAGYARNFGVKQSKGEHLTFLDADDYLQPKFLEYTLSALKHFNADWIYTDLWTQTIYNEEQYKLKCNELNIQGLPHNVIKRKNDLVEFYYRYNCDEWSVEKLYESGIAAVTGLYKRSDFDLVNGFDEDNNREDWDFHLRLAKTGKCGLRLPLPLFTYRLNTGIRREYIDVAKNYDESKSLKLKDIERLHTTYNLEELIMPCTACKKKQIEIANNTSVPNESTLVYVGKITGGTIRGPATGRMYAMLHNGNTTYIDKVLPQDAKLLISRGDFETLKTEKQPENTIVSPTPVKVEVVKLTHAERLQKTIEFAEKAREEAMKQTIAEFEQLTKTDEKPEEVFETEELDEEFAVNWYDEPDKLTLNEIKQEAKKSDSEYIEIAYDNEVMGSARKTVLSYLQGLLK